MQRLQEVRKRYVAIQTLKGVSSAAIVDDVGELSDINAHMDITLIPAYYLLILIQNFNSARPTFEKIDELFDKSVTSPEFEQRNSELEVLNCEGKQYCAIAPRINFRCFFSNTTIIFYVS